MRAALPWSGQRKRGTVNLADIDAPRVQRPPRPPVATTPVRPAFQWLPSTRDGWLRLAEHVIGHWAATLHRAFLLVAGLAGAAIAIGTVFGFASIVLGAAAITLVGVVYSARRHRARARANQGQGAGRTEHRQLRVVPGLAEQPSAVGEQAPASRHPRHQRPAAVRRSCGNDDPVRRRVFGHEIHHHDRWCPPGMFISSDPTTPHAPSTGEWPPPDLPKACISS